MTVSPLLSTPMFPCQSRKDWVTYLDILSFILICFVSKLLIGILGLWNVLINLFIREVRLLFSICLLLFIAFFLLFLLLLFILVSFLSSLGAKISIFLDIFPHKLHSVIYFSKIFIVVLIDLSLSAVLLLFLHSKPTSPLILWSSF